MLDYIPSVWQRPEETKQCIDCQTPFTRRSKRKIRCGACQKIATRRTMARANAKRAAKCKAQGIPLRRAVR